MSSGTKGLSEWIIEQCERNPKYAFFLIPLGLVIGYWAISDARYYKSLRDQPTQTMKDVSVATKPNDRGFTAPFVVGKSGDREISIPIGFKTARNTTFPNEVDFVETKDNPPKYVLRSTLDEQTSQVYFTVAGMPFNFVGILGAGIALAACAWGLLAKPKHGKTTEN
jgi:hypothetical protein